MKKLFTLTAVFGLICVGLLTGCQKSETPSNNAPATPSTNAPAQ
jgi:uncharacterized lipoprotein YajG